MTGRTALYRHFDADGCLLYVGISCNPLSRLKQHSWAAEWFERLASTSVEWLDKRSEAMKAERSAIQNELPEFNRAGVERVCGNEPSEWPEELAQIERFLEETGMAASTLGVKAAENSRAIARIREGRAHISTLDRVVSWIEAHRSEAAK